MKEIIESNVFKKWLSNLRDRSARVRILQRLDRLQAGNAGDTKPIGDGLSELRIDCGPGYRVYYMQKGPIVVILLCGGDKRDQNRDIAMAKELAKAWGEE
ncbi:type II toxin-antitoxin system RelE/ParE family toxin [Oceanisphaera sp. IT1-181]|uniref:type II toxin-antitoxin system RelE/ParE family toxin n=1 Tax=Oceanisphaera sp. IT1-181 TaxID=3081199 RepID=UPI0029CA872D|nr:type II toxin-antitoxin system RelE/ParE family toxin [Oceanisphaera sp. IT1-181]